MSRPVTLFTGQWADLPLETLAKKASAWGFDGLELACWGDHFEVDKALEDDAYVQAKRDLLEKYGLQCFAISTHLVGQCVCDPIDERHKAILPSRIWGDGDPEGVRQQALRVQAIALDAAPSQVAGGPAQQVEDAPDPGPRVPQVLRGPALAGRAGDLGGGGRLSGRRRHEPGFSVSASAAI